MRCGAALLVAVLWTTQALSADAVTMEKVKTGILPTGGFYSIYQVTCRGEDSATR